MNGWSSCGPDHLPLFEEGINSNLLMNLGPNYLSRGDCIWMSRNLIMVSRPFVSCESSHPQVQSASFCAKVEPYMPSKDERSKYASMHSHAIACIGSD